MVYVLVGVVQWLGECINVPLSKGSLQRLLIKVEVWMIQTTCLAQERQDNSISFFCCFLTCLKLKPPALFPSGEFNNFSRNSKYAPVHFAFHSSAKLSCVWMLSKADTSARKKKIDRSNYLLDWLICNRLTTKGAERRIRTKVYGNPPPNPLRTRNTYRICFPTSLPLVLCCSHTPTWVCEL